MKLRLAEIDFLLYVDAENHSCLTILFETNKKARNGSGRYNLFQRFTTNLFWCDKS
jgi:hypothetical protein